MTFLTSRCRINIQYVVIIHRQLPPERTFRETQVRHCILRSPRIRFLSVFCLSSRGTYAIIYEKIILIKKAFFVQRNLSIELGFDLSQRPLGYEGLKVSFHKLSDMFNKLQLELFQSLIKNYNTAEF